jgi:Flp pilus assembly protein TadB
LIQRPNLHQLKTRTIAPQRFCGGPPGLVRPLTAARWFQQEDHMSIQTIRDSFSWYAFLIVFGLVALTLAVSNGAGLVFALILIALMMLMNFAWSALRELRQLRQTQQHSLEVLVAALEIQIEFNDNLKRAKIRPRSFEQPLEDEPMNANGGSRWVYPR